jgi:hypothetical protein
MSNLTRLGITEFKESIGATSLDVVKNPKTQKLFVSTSNGNTYKCQAAIDLSKPVEMLIPDGDLGSACLVNKGTNNVLATL